MNRSPVPRAERTAELSSGTEESLRPRIGVSWRRSLSKRSPSCGESDCTPSAVPKTVIAASTAAGFSTTSIAAVWPARSWMSARSWGASPSWETRMR
jgi:hypothetical protein